MKYRELIQQLIWMFYFIHDMFPDVIKQLRLESSVSSWRKSFTNTFQRLYINIYIWVCTLTRTVTLFVLQLFLAQGMRRTVNVNEWNRPYLLTVQNLDKKV